MEMVDARGLPDDPLDAAARFHADVVKQVRDAMEGGGDLVIVRFDGAGVEHAAWRIPAIEALAREGAPTRLNAVSGDDADAVAAASEYLARAPGVTGQYLAVDGHGRADAAG